MLEVYVGQFGLFLMIFTRVASVIVIAPIVGHQAVPIQIKVGLGLFISFILFPLLSHTMPVLDLQLGVLVLVALKEIALGVLIGYVLGLLFAGIRYGGELISFSMGISIANVFDPESSQNTPVVGEFLYLTTLLLFLVLNGHHFMLEALQASYAIVPIGAFVFSESLVAMLIKLTALVFIVGVKIAAPVLVACFLVNFGLSILARVMPQANIFMLAFPITIGVGLLVLFSSIPMLIVVFKKLLTSFETNVIELLKVV